MPKMAWCSYSTGLKHSLSDAKPAKEVSPELVILRWQMLHVLASWRTQVCLDVQPTGTPCELRQNMSEVSVVSNALR